MSNPMQPRFSMKFFDADGNEMIARLYTDPLFGMLYWVGERAEDIIAHSVVFVPVEVFDQSGRVI